MSRDSWGKWAMAVALVLIVVAGVTLISSVRSHRIPVSIGDQVVMAQVADTDEARRKGLSGTSRLGDRDAMLFVFDVPGRWGMWMRDMHYSIDIVWLDRDKRVVTVAENVSPDTYPTSFLPEKDVLYAIELPAGFTRRYGIASGQYVNFSPR